MAKRLIVLLPLLACARPAPPPPPAPAAPPIAPADPADLLAWSLAGDPLARRPRLPAEGSPAPGPTIRAAALAPLPAHAEEQAAAGTIQVPLIRGARLAELEIRPSFAAADLRLIAPLLPAQNPDPSPARPPLDWLGAPSMEGLIRVMERSVMLGWLDGPDIDRRAVAALLPDLRFDRLSGSPEGRLILALESGAAPDPALAAAALAQLDRALGLALREIAADSDALQAAWKAERAALQAELGTSGDPVNALLTQAQDALIAQARAPRATGGALVARAALRWRERCPDAPCGGLDRLRMLDVARRWGADLYADAWEIAAWKDSIDHLEVALGRASAVYAQDQVVELLVDRVEPRLLLFTSPGPASFLALSRAMGLDGSTDPADLLDALRAELRRKLDAFTRPTASGTAPTQLAEWAPALAQIRRSLEPRPAPAVVPAPK